MPHFAELSLPDFTHTVVVTDAEDTRMAHGEHTVDFPWASVTKVVSAMASLVAIEQGMVDLDEPAGPPGATVRHLLAHTAGLAFDSRQVLAKPGQRRIYSNAGFEVLAKHVEEAISTDFPTWVEETVLVPLGMATSVIEGSPAHGGHGSATDLAAVGRELLRPTLVSQPLYEEATHVVFPGLRGVLPGFGRQDPNDWGLGFEIRGQKQPHWTGRDNSAATFGHFGQSGSFLWVDRQAGLATTFLGAESFGTWAAELWPTLSDAVLADFMTGATSSDDGAGQQP